MNFVSPILRSGFTPCWSGLCCFGYFSRCVTL